MEVSWEWRICIYYTDSLHTHSGFHTGTAFSEWTNFSICSSRRQKAIWSAPKIYSAFQFSAGPVFRGQSMVHWNLQLLWAVPRTAGRWSHGTNYTESVSAHNLQFHLSDFSSQNIRWLTWNLAWLKEVWEWLRSGATDEHAGMDQSLTRTVYLKWFH